MGMGGTFKASLVAGGGIIKTNWDGDLCSPSTKTLPMGLGEIDFQGMSCPVAAGAQSLSMDVKLSAAIPASLATSDVQLDASSSSGDNLICMKLHIQKVSNFARGFKRIPRNSNAVVPVFEITERVNTSEEPRSMWFMLGVLCDGGY